MFFLRDGGRYVVCNVRPEGEWLNPWVRNMVADPAVSIQIGANLIHCQARKATATELENYWPKLVSPWPAYQDHSRRGGERSVFVLEPVIGQSRKAP